MHFSKTLRLNLFSLATVLVKNDRELDFTTILIFRQLIKLNYLKWKRLLECLEMHNYIFIILIINVYFAIACAESKYQNVCFLL